VSALRLDVRFLALADAVPELVSVHSDGGCVYVSAVARELIGVEPADMLGRDWAELVPGEDDNPFRPRASGTVRHRLMRPYAPPLVAQTSVTPVPGAGERLCVTQALDARGWELPDSLHESLTGLATPEMLVERLGSLVALGQTAVAAIVIDPDHLAAVNSRFGRQAGERVLAETARRVREMLRPGDLVGRLEQDRLCALCLGVRDYRAASRIAERVRAVAARPLPFEPVMATASVGAALASSGGDPEDVLRLAAEAAQAAKRHGGNAAEVHGARRAA
jgi:diguanylate cyclase (GGDEF)-like protein